MDIKCAKCGRELEVPKSLEGEEGKCPFCSTVFKCDPPKSTPPESGNTSSEEESFSAVPPAIKRWNWGAFWLGIIWAVCNRVWIGLLMLVPIVNIVMPFILGAKGGQWAWVSRDWDGLEHFQRAQKMWSIWGWVYAAFSAFIVFLLVRLALLAEQ